MADVITTLHPENDNTIDLYPNIKKENIPNGAIDASKIQNEAITETKLAPELQQKLVEEVVSVTVAGESGVLSESTKTRLLSAKVGIIVNNGFVYEREYKDPNDSYDRYFFYNRRLYNNNIQQRCITVYTSTGAWVYSYENKYLGFYDDAEDEITVQKSILGDANVDYIDGDDGDFNKLTIGELKAPVILYGEDELNLESKIDDIEDLAESAYKQGLKNLMTLGQYDYYPATQMGVPMYDKLHRATGYLKIYDCTCQKISQNRFLLGTISGVQIPSSDDVVCDLIANRVFTADTVNNVYNNINTQRMSVTSAGELVIYVTASYYANNTAEQFLASFGDVEIQYALSSSYQHNETIIPNLPLLTLDQNGCNFLREEWEKGLNLLDPNTLNFSSSYYTLTQNNGLFTLVSNGNDNVAFGSFENIYLEKGKTYTISKQNITYDTDGIGLYFEEGGTRYYSQFTPSTSGYYVLYLRLELTYSGTITFNLMINEGDHAYPYQEYNGAIVHKVDIKPVLLWENTNPNSTFTAQAITTSNMTNYKYLIFAVKCSENSGYNVQYFKVDNTIGKTCFIDLITQFNNAMLVSHREFTITNTTTITASVGYLNGSENNDKIIPVAIYGSNIL